MQLRDLPAIDALVNADELESLVTHHGPELIKNHLRDIQGGFRARGEVPEWAGTAKGYAEQLVPLLTSSGYQAVFNLTGTVVHTNLGRSPLSATLWQEVEPLVTQAMNLEYDLASGQRGDRDAVVEDRLVRLTGAEAATVVNNNAAALLLVLNTFALGGKVPVSRGELIEIGGSFRLPDIMERAGCELLEVGTTNRTHLKDFAKVATDAAMFLKVHPSNYHITGFTNAVSTAELAKLANDQQRPLCIDVGSGTLIDLRKFGLPYEPMPQHVLDDGADLVTFSG
ncbi:MAG: L-seryl-tRNA(Sec) selenium transferase, partial [Gammaproteobacteria bacterium]|nr:L-seryl-tRNA(Sec) selenium transferase [Gammaproteobacteria bacterium]